MTWPTHTLLGISALWLLVPLRPEVMQTNLGVLATVATLGALLPDLDASESKIKHLRLPNTQIKPFLLPALVVSRTDRHRGILHSLVGIGMVVCCAFPAAFYIGWTPLAALILGYASHLIADATTKSGIMLFHPAPTRYHLLPKAWRFTTGSLAEEALMAPLALSVLTLLLKNLCSNLFS